MFEKNFFRALKTVQKTMIHLTDVEGNWRYFDQWVNQSKHIAWDKNQNLTFQVPALPSLFVYGGDYCDKGPGDLRIGKALNDFKENYPDSVTLIAGNREAKCRRFTYELDSERIRERLLNGPAAWWQKNKVPPRDYALKYMLEKKYVSAQYQDVKAYLNKLSIEQCQAIYLQWMLTENMGCGAALGKPGTFEYRRQELAEVSNQDRANISDEDVVQSFLESVGPAGQITRYLKQAQLGMIQGDTLFIHGAVTPDNLGYVPGFFEQTGHRITDAREWIEILNTWYKSQVNEWIEQPLEKRTDVKGPGYLPLDQYVLFNPRSIVTTNWYRDNQLAPTSNEVINFLNKAGIYRVVSGHQPFADFPLILRDKHEKATLEVIVGDTGYSDPKAKDDNRGKAIHYLTIVQNEDQTKANIEATRSNGVVMDLMLPSRKEVLMGKDIPIGHFTQEERLIRLNANGELISSQLNGFEVVDQPIGQTSQMRI